MRKPATPLSYFGVTWLYTSLSTVLYGTSRRTPLATTREHTSTPLTENVPRKFHSNLVTVGPDQLHPARGSQSPEGLLSTTNFGTLTIHPSPLSRVFDPDTSLMDTNPDLLPSSSKWFVLHSSKGRPSRTTYRVLSKVLDPHLSGYSRRLHGSPWPGSV